MYQVHSSVRNAVVSYCGLFAVTEFADKQEVGHFPAMLSLLLLSGSTNLWVDKCLVHFWLVASCSYTLRLLCFPFYNIYSFYGFSPLHNQQIISDSSIST